MIMIHATYNDFDHDHRPQNNNKIKIKVKLNKKYLFLYSYGERSTKQEYITHHILLINLLRNFNFSNVLV